MKLYLDTNVIRDCLKHRKLQTIQLMEIIRERKIECFTSIFTVMELIDNEKDDAFFHGKLKSGLEVSKILRQRSNRDLKTEDLDDIWININNLLAGYPFIQFANITEEGWPNAFAVCKKSNLDSDDSIHLATALGSKCDILLTSDSFLKREGLDFIKNINEELEEDKLEMKIMTPEEVLKKLHEENTNIDSSLQAPSK